MSKLRVHSFSISIDGFGAGPDQGNASESPKEGMKQERAGASPPS